MLRNQCTETYYIWVHPLSWKLFSHMQITCYYVTSLCILSIQSLHNKFTNPSINKQRTCSSCVLTIFSLGTLDTNKVLLFITGLAPGSVWAFCFHFWSAIVTNFPTAPFCASVHLKVQMNNLPGCPFKVTLLAYTSKVISVLKLSVPWWY
jgi:hypothetical protein